MNDDRIDCDWVRRYCVLPRLVIMLLLFFSVGCDHESVNEQLLDAAAAGDQTKIEQLIALGANVNYVSKKGDHFTALLWACFKQKYRVAHILLDNGANPNISSRTGKNALFYAVGPRDDDFELVKHLLKRGANLQDLVQFSQMEKLHPGIKELIATKPTTK